MENKNKCYVLHVGKREAGSLIPRAPPMRIKLSGSGYASIVGTPGGQRKARLMMPPPARSLPVGRCGRKFQKGKGNCETTIKPTENYLDRSISEKR